MPDRAEQRYGVAWEAIDVITRAPAQDAPLLVIHDEEDARIPFAEGAALAAAWPRARIKRTSGYGHNRVLTAREVVDAAVAFLREHQPDVRARAGGAS
jgi:pimeloyl-ACP methyl ester carboxylesterase